MRVARAAVDLRPVLPDTLRVLQHARMLQHAGWLSAIFEEGAAVFLDGDRGAERVFHHGDRREAHQPVEAKPRYMEDLVAPEQDILVLIAGDFVGIGMVDVIDLALLVPVHFHILRQQRIQAKDRVFPVSDDLRISIAVQQQMGHQRLPEGKARHLRIRLPVQELIQRMVCRTLFPAAAFI